MDVKRADAFNFRFTGMSDEFGKLGECVRLFGMAEGEALYMNHRVLPKDQGFDELRHKLNVPRDGQEHAIALATGEADLVIRGIRLMTSRLRQRLVEFGPDIRVATDPISTRLAGFALLQSQIEPALKPVNADS